VGTTRRWWLAAGVAVGAHAAGIGGRVARGASIRGQRPDLPPDYIGFVEVPRYFPETRHNVDGEFHTHFWQYGGVDTFGYPLTEEFWTPGEHGGGAGRMVQYFQRARLEFDLGERVVARSLLGELLEKGQPAEHPAPGIRYFPETGHNVGQSFLVFFEQQGGAAALGYPISEEVEENGRPAQWFQRARLEWWPELPPARRVQYGLIGEEHLARVRDTVPAEALRRAEPLPPLKHWALPEPPQPPRVAWAPADVPILYYHQVPSQKQLRDQVAAFREAGRAIVSLGRVVDALRGEGPRLPDKPLVLTFDDSWVSQIENGAPALHAEGVPATFFVITRYMQRVPGYMSWDQARALKELGFEVESHTQNHPDLDRLLEEDDGAATAEVWESLAELESRLGRSKRFLAYPNGRWNAPIAALAARVYRAAVATGGGTFQSQQHLYQMRRIKAEPSYRPEALLKAMGHPLPEAWPDEPPS
jgi:peptidoglycan/xylan/chitin deacetylase (PgdA/CDA1 family)